MNTRRTYRLLAGIEAVRLNRTVLLCMLLLLGATGRWASADDPAGCTGQVIWHEDFEAGWGDWYPDNGVWEIGPPTYGPGAPHEGESVAGTILGGKYAGYQDSRLITPALALPTVGGGERLQLRFWHWFSYSSHDSGTVQISLYDLEKGEWEKNWRNLTSVQQVSAVWSPLNVDLTEHAGKYVRIAFLHTAGRNVYGHASESSGWYIDEVQICKGTPTFRNPEGYELGWGDWYTENGVWEVGEPNSGPFAAYRGRAVVGTVLDGGYAAYTDSRLVSPPFVLPELPGLSPYESLELRFWHWFSYSSHDSGTVQISVYNADTGEWGRWDNRATITGVSGVWTPINVPLMDCAGNRIRIAFLHTAGRNIYGHASESSGWYIDDVQIPVRDEVVIYDAPLGSDPGWEMQGQWQYGVPTGEGGEDHGHPDPTSGYTGAHVIGVNLDGNYAVEVAGPLALIAGPFDLSGYKDVAVEYARYLNTDEPDYVEATVEVSIDNQQSWHPLWTHTGPGPIRDSAWRIMRHDLGSVADGQSMVYVRWSHEILDARAFPYSGWNIDDIKLIGRPQ